MKNILFSAPFGYFSLLNLLYPCFTVLFCFHHKSSSLTPAQFRGMETIMSILYCRNIFQDFRKPVERMYPHLAGTYQSLVKRPMDLGTLLLKTRKREVRTIQEFRTCLQLVHNNALKFNEGMITAVELFNKLIMLH
jgi:hypothetical protein